jgi:outer membrane receptor protein involved in Fe transport
VSLSWKPSSTLNIYAQAAKGYRMGQANVAAAGIPPTYDSDFLWNYEVGVKSSPTDGLNLSVALFTINWEDIQIGLRTPQRFNYTGNAGKARSRGAELTLDWQATPNLLWMTSAAWTDATLREDVANLPQVSGVLGVKKGERLPGQARFSMSNSMTYNWTIGENRDVFLRLDHQYVGKSYNTFTQAGALVMGDYNTFGAGVGVTLGATEVALRASNLGDTDGRMNSFFSSGQTPTAKYLSPRTLSLQVSRRFGD